MINGHRYRMNRTRRFFFLPVIILLFFVLSGLVQWLWNAVLPEVIHTGKLNYWQAAGLLLLSRILFGSFPFSRQRSAAPYNGRSRLMKEKWMNMDEDARRRFKEEFRERCKNRER